MNFQRFIANDSPHWKENHFLLCDPTVHFCLTAEYKVQVLIAGESLYRSRNFGHPTARRNFSIPHSLSCGRAGANLHRTAGF